jgi:hypothetical protein
MLFVIEIFRYALVRLSLMQRGLLLCHHLSQIDVDGMNRHIICVRQDCGMLGLAEQCENTQPASIGGWSIYETVPSPRPVTPALEDK